MDTFTRDGYMEENFLYQRIAEKIRQDILEGRLQPGDRLPSIRMLMREWNCTPGTIQHAYQDLAQQGLVISQIGKGTHVSGQINPQRIQSQAPLRRANMVHRAETFLLESLTAGYDLEEVRQSIDLAMDRWLSLQQNVAIPDQKAIRFSGSHDMAVIWIAGHIAEITQGIDVKVHFTGSLGGLMALAEGQADLAGCHLWDVQSDTYNAPFISKLFPGKKMLVTHLARRRMGLMISPGNPLEIKRLEDLARPGVRFANRQSGSGTRVWLDAMLQNLHINRKQINGYELEKLTHSEVARAIAGGQADAGIGLEFGGGYF